MNQLLQFRQEKDEFFASDVQSPLSNRQKRNFKGLSYFPENPDLSLEVDVEEFPQKQEISMQTSTGETQIYLRYGRFKFNVDGQEAELTIYASEEGFFLPFVDSLAGKETYGSGRYIEPLPLSERRFSIDFNYAYNPYCAYNNRWSCPIPPKENRLKVPIRAGEKVFQAH